MDIKIASKLYNNITIIIYGAVWKCGMYTIELAIFTLNMVN